jgi:hypothetical protein
MAYDEGLASLMREALENEPGYSEKKMFGGLCFLVYGKMVSGVHSGGGMFRVGKANEAEARAIPGTGPMLFTGKPMGGMIEASDELMADDDRQAALMAIALTHAKSLPPK